MRGTIRKHIGKDGTAYYRCIFRAHGKQIWKSFTSRKAAEDYLTDTVSEVGKGTYRRVSPDTMAHVFAQWMESLIAAETLGQLKRSTRRSYCSVVSSTLLPAFGSIQSDELSTVTVSAWKRQVAEQIALGNGASKSYNNACGVLSACLEWAREHAYLSANPLPKKLRARGATTERPVIQGAEITRLWQVVTGQDRLIVALALFAGLRRGEIFGAPWSAVTWPKGRTRASLRVMQAYVQRQITTPKSAASRRDVYLAARLVELLHQHHRDHPPIPLPNGTTFLIRQADGKPVDPDNWAKREWPAIARAAKLPDTITLHILRHTFGSLLLADNVPVKHVSVQMGHASVAFTMNVYQHILKATSATATRQLDKHIPDAQPRPKPLRLIKHGAA